MLPCRFKITFILKLADIESATTKREHYVFVGVDVLGDPYGHNVIFFRLNKNKRRVADE